MKNMKYLAYTVAALWACATSALALPLQKEFVPADAKWLVHLDLDNFRESKLGETVLKDKLAEPLARLKAEAKVDVELILQKLHSITAYGMDFETGRKANGVLLLSGSEETRQIVEGFLAGQILQNTNGPIKQLQREPFNLYSVNDEIFVSSGPGGQILVSKSRDQLDEARKTLAGNGKKARGSDPFSGYASVPNTFFLLAVAEGFNENAALPPQAKILQMADGARIVLGEKAENLFLNLALKAKDSEVIQQIRQVLDGMKALIALGQSENKDLLELVQATQVASSEKIVTVNIEYPFAKAVGKFDEMSKHLGSKPAPAQHRKRDHRKSDPSDQSGPARTDE